MRSYDLYIFDLDDTLVRTFEAAAQVYYPALARWLGVGTPGVEQIRAHWGGDLSRSLMNNFGAEIDPTAAVEHLSGLHARHPVEPVNGALRIVEILKKHHKGVCLFTSGEPGIVEVEIRRGLRRDPQYFDFVFSTMEQGIEKPDPQIIYILMDQYRQRTGRKIGLDRVLVVGDSLADFATAAAAEVDFAAVLTGTTDHETFHDAGLGSKWIFPDIGYAIRPPEKHGIVAVIRNQSGKYLMVREGRPDNEYYGCWSGPHGRCEYFDVIEEETVARETWEESRVRVRAVRPLYTRQADTKVQTVTFWEAELLHPADWKRVVADTQEVDRFDWLTEAEILSGRYPLYPGTVDFFASFCGR